MRTVQARAFLLLLLFLALTNQSHSQDSSSVSPDRRDSDTSLDEVVVSAPRPGPELWRVYREMADGQVHEMWVLGAITPVIRKMKWESGIVEEKIRVADVVLMPTNVKMDVKVGFFSGLLLIPKALSVKKNPGKQTLQQLLPPEVYARWLVAKQQYLGRSRSSERLRPALAASKLYERALKKNGLIGENIALQLVRKTAKRHKRPIEAPTLDFVITDAKDMLNELQTTSFADGECFEQTLQFVERDLSAVKQRAGAWANGDLLALKALPLTEFRSACINAFLSSEVLMKRGFTDLDAKRRAIWLEAAEKTINTHANSFALLPMREMLDEQGMLAALAKRGFQIQPPKELRAAVAEKADSEVVQSAIEQHESRRSGDTEEESRRSGDTEEESRRSGDTEEESRRSGDTEEESVKE
jgi:TraB/PrgY/gumN family